MDVAGLAATLGWDVVEKCTGGEFGAHLVARNDERAVLKYWVGAHNAERIRNSAELAMRVRANGQLAPRYLDVGEVDDAIYTLQEWVDGDVPARLTLPLAQRMVELLDTHTGVAEGWDASRAAGAGDWWAAFDTFSTAPAPIATLAEEILAARETAKGVALPTGDVVHSDYHHKNLLVRDDAIVAIIDWDAAHPGDQWADAFKLMWWSQAAENDFDADVAPWLRPHVEAALTERQLAWYAADNSIGQLEFFQRTYGGEPAEWIRASIERFMAPYWR